MTLVVFAKAILIAVCAALSGLLYFVLLTVFQHPFFVSWNLSISGTATAFAFILSGSIVIGLPVALVTFLLSWRHLAHSPTTLAMVAVLSGIMMVLTSYAIASETGVLTLGIPAFLAALTYGILGWFWVLKPLRNSSQPPPQENGLI